MNREQAKKLAELCSKLETDTYPFNHIKVYAGIGKTEMTKPFQGLSIDKVKLLKEKGYDVKFDMDKERWTVKWE